MAGFGDELPDGAAVGRAQPVGEAMARPVASAGFGSPGVDQTVRRIDLNDALIKHPQATFVMRVSGEAMRDAGIGDGDVVLVDRSLQAASGHVVVAVHEGELIVRRLSRSRKRGGGVSLEAEDADFAPIRITEQAPLEVWGVVTTVIKSLL